jgi:hypothetical protein
MNSAEILITAFYTAFQNKDFRSMQQCYSPGAVFTDSVFLNLNCNEAKAMWHMLSAGAKDLELKFDSVKGSDSRASCKWIATYTFSLTKKKVVNIIHAEFELKDGKIILHKDTFSFYSWARQAFGITGLFLGWTPYFRKKVQATSRKRLYDFISDHKEYQD